MAHNVEVIIKEETNPSHGPNNATCPAAFDVRTVFSALPRDKRRDAPSDTKGNKEDNSCLNPGFGLQRMELCQRRNVDHNVIRIRLSFI